MLLFEFVGELFQFEQREPDSVVLLQLPPRMTALFPSLPFAIHADNPSPENPPHFRYQHLCCFDLVECQPANFSARKKAQPKTQHGEPSVGGIQLAHLVGLSRYDK